MQGIILAGGKGERLMPLTADRPKCLVEVAGRTLIEHQLGWLSSNGIGRVIVSCGYKWQRIQLLVGDGAGFGLHVEYAVEETPLGRGGGLRKGLGLLDASNEPVLACNGDVLTSLPLAGMVRKHLRSGALATLLLVPFVSEHGVVDVGDDDRITGFREKPNLPYWLSGGVYVVSPQVRKLLPARGDHETTTWPRLAKAGQLRGYRYRGLWQPVDSVKDVGLAEAALRRRL